MVFKRISIVLISLWEADLNVLKCFCNFSIFNYILDFKIFVTFSAPNKSINFVTEQCLQSVFGKNCYFLIYRYVVQSVYLLAIVLNILFDCICRNGF